VNDGFTVELAAAGGGPGRPLAGLGELNRLFTAWVEQVYHHRIHSETGAAPLARWMTGAPFALPEPAALAEAFRWSEYRKVTKTATVSLQGNRYQVEPHLAGQKVELVFDPFDLTRIAVRSAGRDAGLAVPFQVTRHAHPKARPEIPAAPPRPTGIDYLALIDTGHAQTLANRINYAALAGDDRGEEEDR
jgi:putative transposase